MNQQLNPFRAGLISAAVLIMAAPTSLVGGCGPSQSDMANAHYQGIENSPIQLKNGRWEGEPYAPGGASRPSVGLVEHFVLRGDLNGDGLEEAVVLLWQNSGGSGTFDYVAVMEKSDGETRNVATAPLGDRVQVRSGSIVDGTVVLDVVQQGGDDGACCPTQLASRSWALEDRELKEKEVRIDGKLSLAVLEGTEWTLAQLSQDHPLPEGAEVTIAFSEGRIAGNSGCNRFSAGIEEGTAPGEIKVGPSMGTRMACSEELMRLETEFLRLLSQVNVYRFVAGGLILGGEIESDPFSLKFETTGRQRGQRL